jgi:hypothetical protein
MPCLQLEEGRRLGEWSDEERRLFMELFLQVGVWVRV